MARWRLRNPHYLNVPGTEWEYKETDQATGRQGRKVFIVPAYLDTDTIVCREGTGSYVITDKGHRVFDTIFEGPPGPDMEALDEEAEAESAAESHKWLHPINDLPGSYSASLLTDLERQVASLMANQPIKPVSVKGVDPTEFAALQAQVAELMNRNAELEAKATRRV